MTVGVLVATGQQELEERLINAFAGPGAPVRIVRRCVDLADLLAAALTGEARAVIVSSGLRRFDRDAVRRLRAARVAVLALADGADAEQALRSVGVLTVLSADADPVTVGQAVFEAVAVLDEGATTRSTAPPGRTAFPRPAAPEPVTRASDRLEPGVQGARIIAVWGPAGAPGRTLIATSLAAEFALAGLPCLLVDADVYAASVAQSLGLLDDVPGLLAAARAANLGPLDEASLAGHARRVTIDHKPSGALLRVLTGLPRADRWPELRPASVGRVLELARSLAAVTVVDCSACLEVDDSGPYELAAGSRNAVTVTVLRESDRVLAVGSADPVGMARLVRGLGDLSQAVPGLVPSVVVNRTRSGPIAGNPDREIQQALARFVGVRPVAYLPEDRGAADAAIARGRVLAEVSPRGGLRLALRALAAELAGLPAPARSHRGRIRGHQRRP